MNKLLLVLILTIISSNVLADWTLVQTGKESDEYVDSATIHISGNLAKMWSLTNISKNIKNIRPGENAFAVKTVREYDCKEHKTRALFIASYNDYMGTGGIERSSESPDAKWKEVTPGIKESFWKIACGK